MKPGIGTKYLAMTTDELLGECQRLDEKVQYLENVILSFQAVAEQHQFTQFAIDNLVMGAFWVTKDGTLMYVNDAICNTLGYTRDELLKMTVLDMAPMLSEELWAAQWAMLKEKKHRSFEAIFLTKDGQRIPMELVINYVEFHGGEFHCVFSRDLSSEKATQQALNTQYAFSQNLIEMAPVMVLVLDNEGRIVRFNPQTTTVTGFELGSVKGRRFSDCFFEDKDRLNVQQWIDEHLMTEAKASSTPVLRIVTRDNERREVVWYERVLREENGAPSGMLVVGQDVTESRELESRLRHSEKMEAIGQLAGGLAHDFNNQLGGILGYADVLKDEMQDNPTLLAYVQNIIRSVKRASDITSQLLTFSRKGSVLSEPVDLNRIVLEVIEILRHSIDKRICMTHQLMDAPALTIGDPTQLQNALLNLALNARDAMPNGGRLSFETQEASLDEDFCRLRAPSLIPGPYIHLTVSDTGKGMDAEVQRRMFEPFFTTKEKSQNSGMGLSTVFGTLKSHKGAILVSSVPGRGTEVSVYLPYNSTPSILDNGIDIAKTVLPSSDNIRVLLAEDEPILQQVASQMLKRLGCAVVVCGDGLEAVRCFEAHPHGFDLVIVDMVMPNLSGKDAFLRMRSINPEVAVILSSGYSLDGEVQALLDSGARAFLQKPFRKRDLSLVIAEVFSGLDQ